MKKMAVHLVLSIGMSTAPVKGFVSLMFTSAESGNVIHHRHDKPLIGKFFPFFIWLHPSLIPAG
jgi:hypothetical protein